jgi:hypothetical protein
MLTYSEEAAKAKKWSDKVTEKKKWHSPEGLFKKSAQIIAETLKKESDDYKQASSRLNFFINRAGDNLSKQDKKKLELAKLILKGLYDKEKEKPKKKTRVSKENYPSSQW